MDTVILLVILVEVAVVAVIMVALVKGVNKALARPQMDVEEIIAKFLQSEKLRNAYAGSIST